MENRRKYPRLDTTRINLLCKKVTVRKGVSHDKTRNISEGGIRLNFGPEPVERGDTLQLEFMLPERRFLIACKGKVVWVEAFEMEGGVRKREYEAGVEFFDIADDDKKAIREYVFSLRPKNPPL